MCFIASNILEIRVYNRNSRLSRDKQTENGSTCDYGSVVTRVAGFYDRTDYQAKVLTKIDRKDRTIRRKSRPQRSFYLGKTSFGIDETLHFYLSRVVLFSFSFIFRKLHIFRQRLSFDS